MRLACILSAIGTIVTIAICGVVIAFLLVATESINTAVLESVASDLAVLRTGIEGVLSGVPPQVKTLRMLMLAWNETPTELNFTGWPNWTSTLQPIGTYQYPFATIRHSLEAMSAVLQSNPSYIYVYTSTQSPIVPSVWGDIAAAVGPNNTTLLYAALMNGAGVLLNGSLPLTLRSLRWISDANTNILDYENDIFRLSAATWDSGFWHNVTTYADYISGIAQPVFTYSVPLALNATTGAAVSAVSIDVTVSFVRDLLVDRADLYDELLFVIDVNSMHLVSSSWEELPGLAASTNVSTYKNFTGFHACANTSTLDGLACVNPGEARGVVLAGAAPPRTAVLTSAAGSRVVSLANLTAAAVALPSFRNFSEKPSCGANCSGHNRRDAAPTKGIMPYFLQGRGAARRPVHLATTLPDTADTLRYEASASEALRVTNGETLGDAVDDTEVSLATRPRISAGPYVISHPWDVRGSAGTVEINNIISLIAARLGGTLSTPIDLVIENAGDRVIATSNIRVGNLHWLVVSSTPRSYYFNASQHTFAICMALCGLIVGVCIVAFALLYIALTRPISRMLVMMRAISKLQSDVELGRFRRPPVLVELRPLQRELDRLDVAVQSFARYVPRDVVRDLISSNELCQLQMLPVHCSMMFMDIRGFTTISERVPISQLNAVVQKYFERMSLIILDHDGVIDKYIGDCIMAIWGVPLAVHEAPAKCALASVRLAREVNVDPLRSAFDDVGEQLAVRIGAASGEVLAGNMGCLFRMNYTVIGDHVNLASRLEGMNKQFGTTVMCDSNLLYRTPRRLFCTRFLGRISVVGKTVVTHVHEILGLRPHWPRGSGLTSQAAISRGSAATTGRRAAAGSRRHHDVGDHDRDATGAAAGEARSDSLISFPGLFSSTHFDQISSEGDDGDPGQFYSDTRTRRDQEIVAAIDAAIGLPNHGASASLCPGRAANGRQRRRRAARSREHSPCENLSLETIRAGGASAVIHETRRHTRMGAAALTSPMTPSSDTVTPPPPPRLSITPSGPRTTGEPATSTSQFRAASAFSTPASTPPAARRGVADRDGSSSAGVNPTAALESRYCWHVSDVRSCRFAAERAKLEAAAAERRRKRMLELGMPDVDARGLPSRTVDLGATTTVAPHDSGPHAPKSSPVGASAGPVLCVEPCPVSQAASVAQRRGVAHLGIMIGRARKLDGCAVDPRMVLYCRRFARASRALAAGDVERAGAMLEAGFEDPPSPPVSGGEMSEVHHSPTSHVHARFTLPFGQRLPGAAAAGSMTPSPRRETGDGRAGGVAVDQAVTKLKEIVQRLLSADPVERAAFTGIIISHEK
jgi:class 3 adenylate cyclase